MLQEDGSGKVEGFVRDELFLTDDAPGTTKRKIATFFLAVSYDLNPPLPPLLPARVQDKQHVPAL